MKKTVRRPKTPLFEVRNSRVHGRGVFALRRIRKGTSVIEYLGDRISHDEANTRYEDKDPRDGHTFLFTVDAKTVIDAGVGGNEARFINHGCDANCQAIDVGKRIFIEAVRGIEPGQELNYDYGIQRDDDDPPDVEVIFACRCGAPDCRGSMLEPLEKKRTSKKRAHKKAARKKAAGKKREPLRSKLKTKRDAVRKRSR
jgi:uncharacterized protein